MKGVCGVVTKVPIIAPRYLDKVEVLVCRKVAAADCAVCSRKDLIDNTRWLDAKWVGETGRDCEC